MTIRPMNWAVIGVLSALIIGAAGFVAWGQERFDGSRAEASEAGEVAREAVDAVGDVERRLSDLEEEITGLKDDRAEFGARLDKVTDRLWASLSNLRSDLAEARAAGDSAVAEAADAAAAASAAARDLLVLESRFEYHLGQHGGG